MQRYSVPITVGGSPVIVRPSDWGEWVKYTDAEAYAEEKAREAVEREREAFKLLSKVSVTEAVKREREEIAAAIVSREYAYLTSGEMASLIRSRGEKESGARKPIERIELAGGYVSHDDLMRTAIYKLTGKLNELIDAFNAMQKDRA